MLASTALRNLKLPEVHLPQRANPLTAHLERSLAEAQLREFHDYIEQGAAFLQRQEVLSAALWTDVISCQVAKARARNIR